MHYSTYTYLCTTYMYIYLYLWIASYFSGWTKFPKFDFKKIKFVAPNIGSLVTVNGTATFFGAYEGSAATTVYNYYGSAATSVYNYEGSAATTVYNYKGSADTTVYNYGGSYATTVYNYAMQYNPSNDLWSKIPSTNTERKDKTVVVIPEYWLCNYESRILFLKGVLLVYRKFGKWGLSPPPPRPPPWW